MGYVGFVGYLVTNRMGCRCIFCVQARILTNRMEMQILPGSGLLSVVVVGLGHIAAKHAVVLARHPRLRIVATVDPLRSERTGSFAGMGDDVLHGTDLGAVLDLLDARVGADHRLVLVATPNGTHVSLARVAVERGCTGCNGHRTPPTGLGWIRISGCSSPG